MPCCKLPVFRSQAPIKIPFYTILGPLLKKNSRTVKKICEYPLLDTCSIYAGLLGLLGTGLSLFDIIRVIRCGSVLPCSLWRNRIKAGRIVSPECERDLKLISLVLSFEYYMLLVFGSITQNPTFFLPWLLLYAFIITVEFTVFACRLFVEGFNFSKHGLLLTIFLIYNWLSVFCTFFHLTNGCSY